MFLQLAALFHPKAKLLISGRKETWKKLEALPLIPQERIWFHCASLGEFEQARPLIEAIKAQQPNAFIAVSFFSPSGYTIRKNYALADVVFYLPADTPSNAKRLVDTLKPTTVFWVKYEYWYFMLSAIHAQKIPNYLVSSIFRKEQPFFGVWGDFFRQQLAFFSKIFVQDEASKTLLRTIGISAIVSGDTRFDRVAAIAKEAKAIANIAAFCENHPIMIAGSTWDTDIEKLSDVLDAPFFEKHRLVIVPHDVTEANIKYIEQQFIGKTVRYSTYTETNQAPILIVDCTGLLSSIYRYGAFAYIGGGFGVCVHNIPEAAVYGLPTLFGPQHKKAKEALDLIRLKGAITVSDAHEFKNAVALMLIERERKAYALVAENYVKENVGATSKILHETLFPQSL